MIDFNAAEALDYVGAAAAPARDLLFEVIAESKTAPGTRQACLKALSHLAVDGAVMTERIIPLLGRVEGENKLYADYLARLCKLLASYGPKAKAAIPQIEKLRLLADPDLSLAAEKALNAIR